MNLPDPDGPIETLPVTPQLALGSDPTTGLWLGENASGHPLAAVVVRGVPAWYFWRFCS